MLDRRKVILGTAATCICLTIGSTPVVAQVRPFCSFSLARGWSSRPRQYVTRQAGANDRSGVPQIIQRIRRELAFQADFTILITAEEDNAFATVANGRKVLGIDVDFLSRMNRQVGTQWAAIQVIAHEVGHHIAGFGPEPHRSELNADYWSGQALQRLGSARTAATAAILAVGTDVDTRSHPNKFRRAETIGRGWDDATRDFIDREFCQSC